MRLCGAGLGRCARATLLLLALFVTLSVFRIEEVTAQPTPTRECIADTSIWPEKQRSILVCWEAIQQSPAQPRNCTCGDGTTTEAPCREAICRRVCAMRGGMACRPESVPPPKVCRGLSATECSRRREIVRQAVSATWEANSQVRFVGWGICQGTVPVAESTTTCNGTLDDGAQGIRIRVGSVLGRTCVGTTVDGVRQGMQLKLTGLSDDQIRKIAVHEFGHVLGFKHEQVRPDTPEWCTERDAGGDVGSCSFANAWDPSSVMNYCNVAWNGNGQLSATDIAALQMFYGVGVQHCTTPLAACSNICVNTSTDVRHCGACGNSCPSDHACVGGTCQSCDCRNRCANSDCGRACACRVGTVCDGHRDCVTCGAFGQPCCDGGQCSAGTCNAGTCGCAAGKKRCDDGICRASCGCAAGKERCEDGVCRASCERQCPPNFQDCGNGRCMPRHKRCPPND
jgi:Dual-action HEIGH metallo-peptidase